MVSYYDVMKAGYELLEEEIEVICGADDKDKADSTSYMGGIVSMVCRLRKLFEDTEKEK